jgi:hypothetical protein
MKRAHLIAFVAAISLGSLIGSLVPANAGPFKDAVGGVAKVGKKAVARAGIAGLRVAVRGDEFARKVARKTADKLNKF